MNNYIPELTAEIATKKFYLRELLSFFLKNAKRLFTKPHLLLTKIL